MDPDYCHIYPDPKHCFAPKYPENRPKILSSKDNVRFGEWRKVKGRTGYQVSPVFSLVPGLYTGYQAGYLARDESLTWKSAGYRTFGLVPRSDTGYLDDPGYLDLQSDILQKSNTEFDSRPDIGYLALLQGRMLDTRTFIKDNMIYGRISRKSRILNLIVGRISNI